MLGKILYGKNLRKIAPNRFLPGLGLGLGAIFQGAIFQGAIFIVPLKIPGNTANFTKKKTLIQAFLTILFRV